MDAQTVKLSDVIAELGLEGHVEGGYFKETYHSENSSAIYFLLSKDSRHKWHRIIGRDEIWHFYAGGPLEVSVANPDGVLLGRHVLGPNLTQGHKVQLMIPANHWQVARCLDGCDWTLVGCTVSPPFEYEHLELAGPDFKVSEGTKN
ncbi:uncharacterized protein [Antedon mediterranea]|uniref:uncharacterized protein n=1 Tax=Antedon mediterranea TaxID=105859 RepID=UPI003AF5421E